MSPDSAAEQLVKFLRTDLQASRKIEIREKAKATFEAGEGVVSKVKSFLRNGQHSAEQMGNSKKCTVSQRISASKHE